MKLNIRTKLLGVVTAIVVLAVMAVGGASYYISSQLVMENFKTSSGAIGEEIARSIQNEYQGYMDGLKQLALNDNFKTFEETGYTTWHRNLLKNYTDVYETVYQSYIGTPDGGMYIYPENDFEEGYDPRVREWYTGAMKTGAENWTKVYESATTGKPSVSGSKVVKDASGKIIGVVAMSMDLERLSKDMSEIKVGETGAVALLTAEANCITHKDPKQVGNKVPVKAIEDQILSGEEGIVNYTYPNADGVVVKKYAVIRKVEGLNWYLMVSMLESEAYDQASVLIGNTFMIGFAAILIAFIGAFVFARSLTKPIYRVVEDMAKVQSGDMTVVCNVRSKDEIGELARRFNDMTSNVRELIENASKMTDSVGESAESLAASSEEVSASADEVSRTVEEIAKGASEQAQDAEAAAMLTSKLDSGVRELEESTQNIYQKSADIKEINVNSTQVVVDLRTKSVENMSSTGEVVTAIYDLEEKSKDIENILTTITSIAEQTNLLALNASIEAARAGEHGRGFSVVADEIRKLAEESSSSAEKIAEIVRMIQGQTHHTVNIVEDLKINTEKQNTAVKAVDESFDNVSQAIEGIAVAIETIDRQLRDMINDKNNIVTAITNISSVSEETAAASEEVSASMQQQTAAVEMVARSAEELNERAVNLKNDIRKFRI
ncbi:MAG: methyl-accepting chemotaxis protein [Tissierellales bacterium]|jgi:methyl-accepting chemotaxis protein|nr:methyl-accepting chemotaxis protein [Tissierellales bacterium]